MLQDLAARLAIPGLPDWVGLVLLLVGLLVVLAYALMPFSVFGVKGRLETIEAQLDEIQTEIRSLALRIPEPARNRRAAAVEDDEWIAPPSAAAAPRNDDYVPPRATPPIPPPAHWPDAPPPPSPRGGRAEPRLDWPTRGGREDRGR